KAALVLRADQLEGSESPRSLHPSLTWHAVGHNGKISGPNRTGIGMHCLWCGYRVKTGGEGGKFALVRESLAILDNSLGFRYNEIRWSRSTARFRRSHRRRCTSCSPWQGRIGTGTASCRRSRGSRKASTSLDQGRSTTIFSA